MSDPTVDVDINVNVQVNNFFGSTEGTSSSLSEYMQEINTGIDEMIEQLSAYSKKLQESIANILEHMDSDGDDDALSDEVISGSGRIWGDPHFIGADGGKYDVQGEAGKTYNLLSDQNFQMNGTFEAWRSPGATVVGEVGINTGADQIEVNKDGTVMVNGQELEKGDRVELNDGGYVDYGDEGVTVESGEWKVDFQFAGNGSHLNMDVHTENALADGVRPHGLLGQTFDGDGEARNGDRG
ncbi:MAG: VWD domain-containing protein, partial [Pseudomonadota bacterium]